jgi:hypothetical protein
VAIRQRFQWSEERGRYRDLRTGRYVSALEVRRAVDQTLRSIGQETRRMADDLRAGRISLDRFRLEMRARTREVHILSAAAARGGMNKMDARAWGQVGGVIAEQDRFIERFIGDIQSGRQPLNGQLNNRAAMYVEAGRTTHERAKREVQADQGMTEERNILRDAKHCGECPELTSRGWVPIGTLPLPGQRECSVNCRCEIETREGGEAMSIAAAPPPSAGDISGGGPIEFGESTGDVFSQEVTATVQGLPETVRSLLARDEVKVRAGRFMTDMYPKLKGVTPRGWPEGWTWDAAPGMYDAKTREVAVTEEIRTPGTGQVRPNPRVAGTLRHEVGHALDDALARTQDPRPMFGLIPISSRREFFDVYERERANVKDWSVADIQRLGYYRQPGNTKAGASEAFAEGFAILQGGGSAEPATVEAFRRRFPNTLAAIQSIIAGL